MASRVAGKKLFLGEYGDATATPFLAHVLDDIVGDHIDFAAIWIWEFYQQSTFKPAPFSVEPGLSEPVIRLLLKSEERAGKAPASTTVSRPRVVLTWPLPCAQINRPAELYAVASDGVSAVNRVDFFADGNPIASIKTPPYRTQFDPVGIPPHTAMIEARAVAASGATASFRSPIRLHDAHNSCDPAQK
jgi:hypothetical protein